MRKPDVCTVISLLTMALGFVVLALMLPTVAGCQSGVHLEPATGPTWAQAHPLPDVLNHAAPVAIGAGVLASTGNPAPLTTSIFDFVKYLLATGGGAVATVGAAKLRTAGVIKSGRDRRGTARVGSSPPAAGVVVNADGSRTLITPPPPPTPSGGAIKPPIVVTPLPIPPSLAA